MPKHDHDMRVLLKAPLMQDFLVDQGLSAKVIEENLWMYNGVFACSFCYHYT